jgi:glycine betaine/proline transport system substrate-binding protein
MTQSQARPAPATSVGTNPRLYGLGAATRRKARLILASASVCLAILVSACAHPEARSFDATSDIDPAIAEAIRSEGAVTFHDGQYMENSLQAHLMAEIVNAIGGEAEVIASGQAQGMAAMCTRDDMVSMDFWRWQYQDGWQQYVVEDKCIVEIGTSNYQGEEGWYVPTYVIEGDPERGIEPMCPDLPDWEALNKCTDVFETAKTAPKGQYMTGAESWAPAYGDEPRIANLKLNYEMVFAGSEAALFTELSRAYEQGKPWLGLMWRPNYLTQKYDLTRIEFPPYTDDCWATTHACQWPETVIYQIASARLESAHPTVWRILQNYDLNGDQLKAMQALVSEDGKSIEAAAKIWMKDNPEVWKSWL